MTIKRYSVKLIQAHGSGKATAPTLLIPYDDTAVVKSFIDELWKRIARQGLPFSPDTLLCTLHVSSETGAVVDANDVLAFVIEPNELIFVTFEPKPNSVVMNLMNGAADTTTPFHAVSDETALLLRVITPATAVKGLQPATIRISLASTIRQLYGLISQHLQLNCGPADDIDTNECNCKLANELSKVSSSTSHFYVVHTKSEVQCFELSEPTLDGVKAAVLTQLGPSIESSKKLQYFGHETVDGIEQLRRVPAVAICSKHRHTPIHARSSGANEAETESARARTPVLDLHTYEIPIHPGSGHLTIEQSGLASIATDGVLDIFAIKRASTGSPRPSIVGRSSIYRYGEHWEPLVEQAQTERAMAMFLSSLRVFAAIVELSDDNDAEHYKDAVLHVLDLVLGSFVPAIRAFSALFDGALITFQESAAISQVVYHLLDRHIPKSLLGASGTQVFLGSRLFFGFILEKARMLKLLPESQSLPYLSSLKTIDLRDVRTHEAVFNAQATTDGLVEKGLYSSNIVKDLLPAERGMIVETNVQIARVAMLSAGSVAELLTFNMNTLSDNYKYRDGGRPEVAFDMNELCEMGILAEYAGKNKLTVYKPMELGGGLAPCLTFDRKANIAVYQGEEACGLAGRSTTMFRPLHTTETVDAATIEQIVAPILKQHEADGTAIFEAGGVGVAVRRLQKIEELLVICVDVSASMGDASDFAEVNDAEEAPQVEELTAATLIELEYYDRITFEDLKGMLIKHESFDDLVAMVAECPFWRRRYTASCALEVLRAVLSDQLVKRHEELGAKRLRAMGNYHLRHGILELETRIKHLKAFWAGLQTHEQGVIDFLVWRGNSALVGESLSQKWMWKIGDDVPTSQLSTTLPVLPAHLTEVPDELLDPISQALLHDPVTAADGRTYERQTIESWFEIRHSSPLFGTELTSTTLTPNEDISAQVSDFAEGADILAGFSESTPCVSIDFVSPLGSFCRKIPGTGGLDVMYKLVFRALRAKYSTFQLAKGFRALPTTGQLSDYGIEHGDRISIRIADDSDIASSNGTPTGRRDLCLLKLYRDPEDLFCAYWVDLNTTVSVSSMLFKAWRCWLAGSNPPTEPLRTFWVGLRDNGDGKLTGHPCEGTDNLSKYLNREYAFGILGKETVYLQEADVREPNQPLVLKVLLSRKRKTRTEQRAQTKLTRLDVLKETFQAMIGRLLAYQYRTSIGLVTIASNVVVKQALTTTIEDFRGSMTALRASGDTKLWDGISLAAEHLREFAEKYPQAKKRIICISDGVDTKSTGLPWYVYSQLRSNNIALDSVCLGDQVNYELRAISSLLGCYSFHPTNLMEALQIVEMEPMLSLKERPDIVAPAYAPRTHAQLIPGFRTAMHRAHFTVVNDETMPARKNPNMLEQDFIFLTPQYAGHLSHSAPGSSSKSTLRLSRMRKEIGELAASPLDYLDVYICEQDFTFLKLVMGAPSGTPYEGGVFLLYLHADEGYPTYAPALRFVTKIKHPNVNFHGRVCHSMLTRDWYSSQSLSNILATVYGLMLQPERSDPVNVTATLDWNHDEVEYAAGVREWVKKYASKPRDVHKLEILKMADDHDMDLEDADADDEDDWENGTNDEA